MGGHVPTVGDWPLLTTFCVANVAAWQAVPGAFDTATQRTSPLLRLAIERLRKAPTESLPKERRAKNPFKPLVVGIAVEPKKKRPRAEKVKVPPPVKKVAVAEPLFVSPTTQAQPIARKRGLLQRMLGRGKGEG